MLDLVEQDFEDSNENQKRDLIEKYEELLQLTSRIVKEAIYIGEEHRNLKRPFIYNGVNYLEQTYSQMTYFKDVLEDTFELEVKQSMTKTGLIVN